MNTRSLLWGVALSGMPFAVGCGPGTWDRYPYGSSSYYGGYPSYYGGYTTPYYGAPYYSAPYYGAPYYHGRPYRSHSPAEEQAYLGHKYDKAMNRLNRQQQEAEAKLARRYGGNTADPRFQERESRVDRRYDYKRGKVERNVAKEQRRYYGG